MCWTWNLSLFPSSSFLHLADAGLSWTARWLSRLKTIAIQPTPNYICQSHGIKAFLGMKSAHVLTDMQCIKATKKMRNELAKLSNLYRNITKYLCTYTHKTHNYILYNIYNVTSWISTNIYPVSSWTPLKWVTRKDTDSGVSPVSTYGSSNTMYFKGRFAGKTGRVIWRHFSRDPGSSRVTILRISLSVSAWWSKACNTCAAKGIGGPWEYWQRKAFGQFANQIFVSTLG